MNILFITKPWRLEIDDKIEISEDKFCPAHYFPHKIPFITSPITDEPCHIHKKKWRMVHHTNFCKWLKCPHYEFMIKRK